MTTERAPAPVKVDRLMREIEDDVRRARRKRLLARGGAAEYRDPAIYEHVDIVLRRALDARDHDALLLPDFLSSDPLLHNIHSFSQANPSFNRAQPKGRTISVAFNAPEIIRIDCDLHSWMRAWVVVAEHPYYVVTGDRGEFVLENVPPGKHTIRIWQERLRSVTQEVTVADTGVSTVTVEMTP